MLSAFRLLQKMCENTCHFLHPFTDVLMQSILTETIKSVNENWKIVEAKNNIICSFGILIVRVCDQDLEKGTV